MSVDHQILRDKFKTGKRERTPDSNDLMLANYVDPDHVKKVFAAIVQEAELGIFDFSEGVTDWMMLLNNKLGDCVPAGIMETQYVLSRLGGHHFDRSDQAAEKNYEAMGGYVPGDASTDQGCDLRVAAKVWQKQGVLDSDGTPRHAGLYVFLEPGNVPLLFWAIKMLKAAVLGYDLPRSAMEQTYAAEEKNETPVWTFDSSSPSEGGHCVPSFGRMELTINDSGLVVAKSASWGMNTMIATDFIENKMDDGFVVVSGSVLQEGQIEGFDHAKLLAEAKQLAVSH
jgi:hypothetical protein